MALQDKINRAFQIGQSRFHAGESFKPAADIPEMMDLVGDMEIGQGATKVLKAYNNGFFSESAKDWGKKIRAKMAEMQKG